MVYIIMSYVCTYSADIGYLSLSINVGIDQDTTTVLHTLCFFLLFIYTPNCIYFIGDRV